MVWNAAILLCWGLMLWQLARYVRAAEARERAVEWAGRIAAASLVAALAFAGIMLAQAWMMPAPAGLAPQVQAKLLAAAYLEIGTCAAQLALPPVALAFGMAIHHRLTRKPPPGVDPTVWD